MEEIFSLISSYGFPMVLSIYLLLRFEMRIKELKSSLDALIILQSTEKDKKHINYLQ
ncbi:MAG: YvrJ family protein [Halanaerobium sp. MSAO_Bac5]|nr:MAG: YvrJ family protein [Halanaerobium sp. MSAO_Bac5]